MGECTYSLVKKKGYIQHITYWSWTQVWWLYLHLEWLPWARWKWNPKIS